VQVGYNIDLSEPKDLAMYPAEYLHTADETADADVICQPPVDHIQND